MLQKLKEKKALLLTGLFLLVIAAGWLNFALTGDKGASTDPKASGNTAGVLSAEGDSFAVFKQERETTRSQEISYIDSVINSTEVDDGTKDTAQNQKLALVSNMEAELLTEGLIESKLGVKAVVTVNEGGVNVVVDKTELVENEVTQIAEIIKTQTKAEAKSIKIMPKTGENQAEPQQ